MMRVLLLAAMLAGGAGQPNVLVIITDDQGWGDIRSHGNEKIDTPVLDRLASEGARFERFFVSPVCAPTRASLLTGRWHLRTGVCGVTRGWENMRPGEVTLAEALRAAGYATGCFGKWHNGAYFPFDPRGQGFQEFLGFLGGHHNNYFDSALVRNGAPVRAKGYITDALTDEAIRFIEARRGGPFFCYVAYNAPHSPFQLPDRHFEKYKARGFDDRTASVYGMVEGIDESVGRLLEKLEELGLAKDTIVVFLTDNGPNSDRYNGGMKGRKGSVHEGGVRVPLFVRWPGRIPAGRVVKPIAAHVDLMPTLLELCGVPAPAGVKLDGSSLAPLLEGKEAGWPERTLFTHQAPRGDVAAGAGSARTPQYRWVLQGRKEELYDMAADPGQERDVSKERPEVARKLREAYQAWLADVTREAPARPVIPVGHEEAPQVDLAAQEAYLSGGVKYRGGAGFANDWITGWASTGDSVSWEIEAVRPGRYSATLLYTCPASDVGARIRVEAGAASAEAVLDRAHDPAPLPSPDRVPRGEVYEKEWGRLEAGALELPRGRAKLVVRALSKPGKSVADLKGVVLRRLP